MRYRVVSGEGRGRSDLDPCRSQRRTVETGYPPLKTAEKGFAVLRTNTNMYL